MHIYIYIYVCVCVYTYKHIYIQDLKKNNEKKSRARFFEQFWLEPQGSAPRL